MSDSDVSECNGAHVDLVPVAAVEKENLVPTALVPIYVCGTCRQPFEQNAKNFSPVKSYRKDGSYKEGFMTKCRQCERDRVHNSRQKQLSDGNWIQEAAENGIKLWEKQPNESIEAFECFTIYRSLYMPGNKRPTINMVAERVSKGFSAVTHHSKNWRWPVRLDAYIAELDRTKLAMEEEARREMLVRHVQTAIDVQKKATDRLATLLPEDLGVKEVIQYIDTAIKIERQARADSMMGTVHESDTSAQVNNVQININTDQNQSNLAGILSILERSGALATVMGDNKKAPIVDIYPADEDGAE